MESFGKICLTCLCKTAKVYSLSEIVLEKLKIVELLHKTISLSFDNTKIPLPKIICQNCLQKLIVSYKFQKQCLDSIKLLHKLGTQKNMTMKEEIQIENNELFIVDYTVNEIEPELFTKHVVVGNGNEEHGKKLDNENSIENPLSDYDCSEMGIYGKYKADNAMVVKQCKGCKDELSNVDGFKNISSSNNCSDAITCKKYQSGKYNNKCEICNKIFKTYTLLQRHLSRNHSFNNPYSCEFCEHRFKTRPKLLKHEKSHDENIKERKKEATINCKQCKELFRQPDELVMHIKEQHDGVAAYQCNRCEENFKLEEHYIQHCNMHLGLKTFQCPQCPKAFDTKSCLNQHLITHSKVTSFLCTICGKAFSRSNGLKQHMQRHSNEKPFQCSLCPKSFKCAADRYAHTMTHTSEKCYECKMCGTHFGRPDALTLHENAHKGKKPYKCDFCEKSFTSLSNMKTHRRIHTGEKPYKCEHCNRTFTQSGDMKKHIKRVHKEEPKRASKIK